MIGRSRGARPLLLLLLAVVAACADEQEDGLSDSDELLTLQDYFAEGHRLALRHAEASDDLARLYARVRDAVVRVHVRWSADLGTTTTEHGSGAIVGGGRFVATAGHVVTILDERPDGRIEIILTDGRVVRGEAVEYHDRKVDDVHEDWALIRLVDAPENLPFLELGEPRLGMRAMLLGYPSQTGIDGEGALRADLPSRPTPLGPLASVVAVERQINWEAPPVAGAVPTGGISGGPLVDAEGRVVGTVHRVTNHHDWGEFRITCDFDELFDLARRLEKER